jgi:hypothetical protein
MSTESLANHVFVCLKGEVAKEEGIRRGITRVSKLLRTIVGAILWCCIVSWSSEVDICDSTIDLCTFLSSKSSCCIGCVGKLNISKALGASRVSVSQDASAGKLTELLKLAVQPLVIDVPAQVTYEEVLDALSAVDLGLLGRSDWFFFGLALF